MRKHAFSTAEDLVSIRVPKKLAGKKSGACRCCRVCCCKRRLAEVSDVLEKIIARLRCLPARTNENSFLSR